MLHLIPQTATLAGVVNLSASVYKQRPVFALFLLCFLCKNLKLYFIFMCRTNKQVCLLLLVCFPHHYY